MNLKISTNEDFICFHDFSERVKHNKNSYNEELNQELKKYQTLVYVS